MSREIKFRSWYGPESHMITGDELQTGVPGTLNEYFLDPAYSFMQYTGLKDTNGMEIYEGDILGGGDVVPGVVTMVDGAWRLHQGPTNSGHSDLCAWRTERLPIIGNIYENPELLEAKDA